LPEAVYYERMEDKYSLLAMSLE